MLGGTSQIASFFDHLSECRHLAEQARRVPKDGAGLEAVGGDDRDRRDLAGTEERGVIAERGEVDRDQCQNARLASAPTDHQRDLTEKLHRLGSALGVAPIELKLIVIHRYREQRLEKHAPGLPRCVAEVRGEDLRVIQRADDVGEGGRSRLWAMVALISLLRTPGGPWTAFTFAGWRVLGRPVAPAAWQGPQRRSQ